MKINNLSQETIKECNMKRMISILKKDRELTKLDIAKETGISITTVGNNINELLEKGIIEEAGVADSTGGRKPIIVRFSPNSRYSFGVDFSSDRIIIILTNLDSDILYRTSFKPHKTSSVEDIIKCISITVKGIIEEKDIQIENICGIGFALPGTVNEEKRILETAPNLKIKDLDFSKFGEYFNMPIFIENEANAAALAELTLGIAKQLRNLVYISITHGIGTGIVIEGHLYKGKNKRAGEFGHMSVVANGKACNCGRNGCWELYASDRALLEDYNKITEGTEINTLDQFFEKLDKKEATALRVWERYVDFLAVGIQNIILLMDPHYVIIGGEISLFEQFLIEPLCQRVFIKNSFYGQDDIKIFASKLKENSSALGASLLPFKDILY